MFGLVVAGPGVGMAESVTCMAAAVVVMRNHSDVVSDYSHNLYAQEVKYSLSTSTDTTALLVVLLSNYTVIVVLI